MDRAATCGAVAAASGRLATGVSAPLPLEAIGKVLHYPMLAGSAGDSFSSDTATQVQTRMAELQDSIGEGKWQDLIPACQAAFPATTVDEVTLPADTRTARLGCDELGDFLRSALKVQEEYAKELGEYRRLSNEVERRAGGRSSSSSRAAAKSQRDKALATMVKAGPPVAVMRQCLERFG
ncbi:hypothetical protein BH24PSE1_BH24PSE1_12290 [soil metagenome]